MKIKVVKTNIEKEKKFFIYAINRGIKNDRKRFKTNIE